METVIVICLVVVILLLAMDKITITKSARKRPESPPDAERHLPDVMGRARPRERLALPNKASGSQKEEQAHREGTFEPEAADNGFDIEIPQEELDEVFGQTTDLEEEEEEWKRYIEPNGEDGLAQGVTFEELSIVGAVLQQELPAPALQERAVDIVQKIQGTDLLHLLESSMEHTSERIARLLDSRISAGTDSGSSTLRQNDLDDFNIREFI